MTTRGQRGVTLLEVMIASAIAIVIALGLAMVEGTRARVHEDTRRRVVDEPERKNASLAALHIAKSLETADRMNLVPATSVYQVRMSVCPTSAPPSCFDAAVNYQWVQYRLNANELRLYQFARPPAGCPAIQVLAREITALTINVDPLNLNNGAMYSLTWTSGARNQTFPGQVITRLRPETGAPFGLQDPSLGDLSPPPAACP